MVMVTNQNATLSAVLAGSQGLVKGGAGTLFLSGANTFTGGLTVNAGTVSVSSWNTKANAQPIGRGDITLGGGLLLFNSSSLAGADQVFEIGLGDAGLAPGSVVDSVGGLEDGDVRGHLLGGPEVDLCGRGHQVVILVERGLDMSETVEMNRRRGGTVLGYRVVQNGDGKAFAELWHKDRAQALAYLRNDLDLTAKVAEAFGVAK